jgi:hypothetical protein
MWPKGLSKLTGVKVYQRWNQNIRPHAVTACTSYVMHLAVISDSSNFLVRSTDIITLHKRKTQR